MKNLNIYTDSNFEIIYVSKKEIFSFFNICPFPTSMDQNGMLDQNTKNYIYLSRYFCV